MKKNFHHLLIVVSLLFHMDLLADGKQLFRQNCASCHTIGKGRMVGPDLEGVNTRRNVKWLTDFIRSSQTMIKSGDPVALTLFADFNKVSMPDQLLSEDEILSILTFIGDKNSVNNNLTEQVQSTPNLSEPVAKVPETGSGAETNLPIIKSAAQISELFMKGSIIGLSLVVILLAFIILELIKKFI